MAGIFGNLFNYSKPGKGVYKDEPKGSRFVYFWKLVVRKFWRLIQINLLYLLFCLPIVTIGAATAGFTYVLRNMANEQPVFLFSDFWDAFKLNWKQSTLYFLLTVLFSLIVSVSVQFYIMNIESHAWMFIPAALSLFIALIMTLMSFYMYLLIVTLDLPFTALLKNAAIFSIVCLKTNLITLFFTAVILVAAFLFLPISLLFILLIIPAFIGFMVCYNSYPGIKKYAIDPYLEAQEAQQQTETAEQLFKDDEPSQES